MGCRAVPVDLVEDDHAAGPSMAGKRGKCPGWIGKPLQDVAADDRIEGLSHGQRIEITDHEADIDQAARGRRRGRGRDGVGGLVHPDDAAALATTSAARNETSPAPLPTSSTRMPGATPAATRKRRVMGSISLAWKPSRRSSSGWCPSR